VIVRTPDEATAGLVRDSLAVRGFPCAEEPGQTGVFVSCAAAPAVEPDVAVLFGLPLELATLQAWLEGADCAVACVEPRHIAQLGIMLRRVGWRSQEAGWPLPPEPRDAIEDYRSRIREGAGKADTVSQLLLLAPVLEELGPLPVLAALSELVRRGETEAPSAVAPAEAAVRSVWTSIFLNVGKKDGAGPGDIVGAITGETPAVAAQIGKIEVRANHTIVELDSLIADEVIAALHGSRIKGRSVSARRDRDARGVTTRRPRKKGRSRGA
jgi:hypothetical protein